MKRLLALFVFALGAFAQSHSATLTWTVPTEPSGTGYDVYRAVGTCPSSGIGTLSYTLLNSTPLTVLTYTDTTVTGGTTYCYYVTASLSGVQSGPSPTAGAAIPSTFPPTTLTVVVQ